MDSVVAFILAGGEGNRLSILAEDRAKPAVPFAGKYRIIDFTLSNCVLSGITRVGVLTQYNPRSLVEHIGRGDPWGLDRPRGGVSLLQPHTDRRRLGGWYTGTADAVRQNLDFVEETRPQQVLVLAGDHVYRMRYDDMVAFHRASGADVTVGAVEVPWEEASRFGILVLDEHSRVTAFYEKPARPPGRLASMGIYVFTSQVLKEALEEDALIRDSSHDFGRDLLPALVDRYRVLGYRFHGYWQDVGTVEAYWQANMDLLEDPSPLGLDGGDEAVRTRHQERPPAQVGRRASVQQTLLCDGCVVQGSVRHSLLSPGVVVEEGAVVEDSVLLDDAMVKRGAVVRYSVVDKEVVVGEGAVVGDGEDYSPNRDEPENLRSGITLVGKRAVVPPDVRIGRNCKVMPEVAVEDYPPEALVPSGSTVEKGVRRLAGVPVAD